MMAEEARPRGTQPVCGYEVSSPFRNATVLNQLITATHRGLKLAVSGTRPHPSFIFEG
jgi:hypothetical protein